MSDKMIVTIVNRKCELDIPYRKLKKKFGTGAKINRLEYVEDWFTVDFGVGELSGELRETDDDLVARISRVGISGFGSLGAFSEFYDLLDSCKGACQLLLVWSNGEVDMCTFGYNADTQKREKRWVHIDIGAVVFGGKVVWKGHIS